jgi:hypothetical protein
LEAHTLDKLKDMIIERTGLSEEMADKVVDAVTDFIKKNPEQVTKLLGDGSPAGGIGKKLGGLLNKKR